MTADRVMCPCKAGRGLIPSHMAFACCAKPSSSPALAVGICQERTFTLPGARNCITTRLLTGPFPRRGSGCPASPSPCSRCRHLGLQPAKGAPGTSQSG